MNFKRALKWAVHYKVLSWIAAALGLGLFAAGWVVGFGALFAAYQSGDIASALSVGTVLAPLVLTALGFLVWQLGKTMAFYRTLSTAIETEMAERFDSEMIKSDILAVLDERLEEMHQEIESTNRAVRRLDGPDPAAKAGFDTGGSGASASTSTVGETGTGRDGGSGDDGGTGTASADDAGAGPSGAGTGAEDTGTDPEDTGTAGDQSR